MTDGAHNPLLDFFVDEVEREVIDGTRREHRFAHTEVIAAERELMAFWLAAEQYAVPIVAIQEIIKVPEITQVPRVGSAVLGIISLRGVIVPLLDLRVALGLEAVSLTRAARILVLHGDGDPIGLVVDRVTSVTRIAAGTVEATPATMQQDVSDMLEGVGRIDDELLIILEVNAVIRRVERAT